MTRMSALMPVKIAPVIRWKNSRNTVLPINQPSRVMDGRDQPLRRAFSTTGISMMRKPHRLLRAMV